jgi:hypothetical protein
MKKLNWTVIIFLLIRGFAFSQEFTFGDESSNDFGFDSGFGESGMAGASTFGVKISGEISAEIRGFYDEMNSAGAIKNMELGDIFSGELNFSASGTAADAVVNLKLAPVFDKPASPVSIDEAYLRAYFGPVNVEAGIRKLSWGKADSFGPLDVINPLDYSDLSKMNDLQGIKIARPMIHASWGMGTFSKLEAVFVPFYKGHVFAGEGPWTPAEFSNKYASIESDLTAAVTSYVMSSGLSVNEMLAFQSAHGAYLENEFRKILSPDNINGFYPANSLKYAQAGLRFTTTVASSDFGFQYYFGRLPRPVFTYTIDTSSLLFPSEADKIPDGGHPYVNADSIHINLDYNYYHQIGIDFARIIAGFNLRAEAGVNITKDPDGKDEEVYNPSLIYSLGFDRDLFWGININLQGTGGVRFFHSQIKNPRDVEAGKDMTSTRITAVLSKKFLRDELELKATGLWGIEDSDFFIIPALIWSKNEVSAELQAGFFGGDRKGELGQYRDNSYIKAILKYSF